jgi:hypothetical protein
VQQQQYGRIQRPGLPVEDLVSLHLHSPVVRGYG